MQDDQGSIPTRPIPVQGNGEPPRRAPISDSQLGGMIELGRRSQGTAGEWQPPAPEELQLDFPLYEIRGILGRGGMGAVYKGWQKSLDRLVAIKILPPGLDDGIAGFTERFKREAKAMAQLKHPGIVGVHDAGQTPGGLLYFVMECVEGTDVQRLVTERGRLDPGEALRITSAVCDALGYAHAHGLIHRDIKPSNIMIEADGSVKVADFGLAKFIAAESTLFTMSDITMGTPDFMAPEALLSAANVDHRADIYAVGIMLYQMLTGRIPRGRFVPPSRAVPGLDRRIDRIVDRALQTEPAARYSSALEMKSALERVPRKERNHKERNDKERWLPAVGAGGGTSVADRRSWIFSVAAAVAVLGVVAWFVFGTKVPQLSAAGRAKVAATPSSPEPAAPPPPMSGEGAAKNAGEGAAATLSTPSTTPSTAPEESPSASRLDPKFVPLSGTSEEKLPAVPYAPSVSPPVSESSPFPDNATKDAPFVNTVGMKFVPVPGAKILFSIWETRVRDYAEFAKIRKLDDAWKQQERDGVAIGLEPDHPVVAVTWDEANAFCMWLTEKESKAGKLPKGATYRLPGDVEWSTAVGLPLESGATPAARNYKDKQHFPWGTKPKPEGNAGNYGDETYHDIFREGNWEQGYVDGYPTTAPVGSFRPNALGIYDLGGNVWEWCEDWFDDTRKARVARGAAWDSDHRGSIAQGQPDGFGLLSARRSDMPPDYRGSNCGFRCVLELEPAAAAVPAQSPAPPSETPPSPASPDFPKPDSKDTPAIRFDRLHRVATSGPGDPLNVRQGPGAHEPIKYKLEGSAKGIRLTGDWQSIGSELWVAIAPKVSVPRAGRKIPMPHDFLPPFLVPPRLRGDEKKDEGLTIDGWVNYRFLAPQ